MRLPGFLRALIGAMTLHAYDAAKAQLRADIGNTPDALVNILDVGVRHGLDFIRTDLCGDVERVALFTVLFRSQADQARRSDSIDATLGVFLTALLAVGPFAFEHTGTNLDRWIVGSGFVLAAMIVGIALFFVGGREPRAGLAAKLARDLRSRRAGSYDAVVATINRAADDAFFVPTDAEEEARGAAGDVAQLFMQDRASLRLKRRLTYAALVVTIGLSIFAGYRDVLQSAMRDAHAHISTAGAAVSSDLGSERKNTRGRQADLRSGHADPGLGQRSARVAADGRYSGQYPATLRSKRTARGARLWGSALWS